MAQPHTAVDNIVTRARTDARHPQEGEPSLIPVPAPVRTSASRSPITLHSALLSTLRLWLIYRDDALWTFMSGSDPADPLEAVTYDQAQESVDLMNAVRRRCYAFAKQISEEGGGERSANQVLRAAVDDLMASESPRFLLTLPDIPGSF